MRFFSLSKQPSQPRRRNIMKTWKIISAAVATMAIVALGYLPFGSAEEGKNIEQMIAEAKTPADHEAIAAYYEKEAQDAQQKYEEHLKLKAAYAKIPHLASKTGLPSHCDSITKKYENIAKDYEALAKLHKGMAKSAK